MRKVIEGPTVKWVDIQNPSQEDIEYLRENFVFHPLVLQEIIPQIWRTKVEVFPDHLFLVLHYPLYNKQRKETRPQELDIVITKNAIITSHYHSLVPIKALFDKCNLYPEARATYMNQGAGFLLFHVLNELWQSALLKIDRISSKLDRLEDAIFSGKEAKILKEISFAKIDIIDFLEIISPQGETLESLRKQITTFFNQELEPYFSHLVGHWNQAKNSIQTYKETIQAYEETNNSLLTNRTNEIVKLLTIFSVIVFPLSLLAAIFGMNTRYLPIVGLPGDFWIVTGVMALGVVGLITYFKHKKWI